MNHLYKIRQIILAKIPVALNVDLATPAQLTALHSYVPECSDWILLKVKTEWFT